MANFLSSSITVRVQLLGAAGEVSYTGDPARGLNVWGAQLELGEYFQDLRTDLDSYRYTRTRATSSSYLGMRFGADNSPDAISVGLLLPYRVSGSTQENFTTYHKIVAKKGGTASDVYTNINNTPKNNAAQTADVFANYKDGTALGRRWFQMAPYYSSYAHAVDYPTDPTDVVRLGSRTGGFKTAPNAYESIAFYQIPKNPNDAVSSTDRQPVNFYAKNFYETKTIPRIPKYDAAQVMEIFGGYTKPRNISTSYTTLSGDYTYYRNSNWYSPLPNTRWSRFAFGSGDQLGPVMREVFEFNDTLTLTQTFKLPPDYFSTPDRIFNQFNLSAKLAVVRDIYTKTGNYTTSNAAQVVETYVNYKDGSWFGRSWFRLAPYYNSYTHVVYPQTYLDLVLQTDVLKRDVAQDLFTLNNGSSEDFQTATGSEDYQLLPV